MGMKLKWLIVMVLMIYIQTFTVFPGLALEQPIYGLDDNWTASILVLTFNLADMISKYITAFTIFHNYKLNLSLIIFRFLFILSFILMVLCIIYIIMFRLYMKMLLCCLIVHSKCCTCLSLLFWMVSAQQFQWFYPLLQLMALKRRQLASLCLSLFSLESCWVHLLLLEWVVYDIIYLHIYFFYINILNIWIDHSGSILCDLLLGYC